MATLPSIEMLPEYVWIVVEGCGCSMCGKGGRRPKHQIVRAQPEQYVVSSDGKRVQVVLVYGDFDRTEIVLLGYKDKTVKDRYWFSEEEAERDLAATVAAFRRERRAILARVRRMDKARRRARS